MKLDSIGRATLTPEEALNLHTDLSDAEIDRLLDGTFDITDFDLANDNLGFFRGMNKGKSSVFIDKAFISKKKNLY